MVTGEGLMDDGALIPIPGLVCPICSVVVHCDYSRSYLRDKALVDGEVEVIHHCDADKEGGATAGFHMNTVKLNTTQLDRIKDLLSKG
jgi:hypothetical protein